MIQWQMINKRCAGADPNEARFKRAACFDVGLECGGWGRIVMELSVKDRKKE